MGASASRSRRWWAGIEFSSLFSLFGEGAVDMRGRRAVMGRRVLTIVGAERAVRRERRERE